MLCCWRLCGWPSPFSFLYPEEREDWEATGRSGDRTEALWVCHFLHAVLLKRWKALCSSFLFVPCQGTPIMTPMLRGMPSRLCLWHEWWVFVLVLLTPCSHLVIKTFLFQNYDTTESKLRREFEVYGPIKRVAIDYYFSVSRFSSKHELFCLYNVRKFSWLFKIL